MTTTSTVTDPIAYQALTALGAASPELKAPLIVPSVDTSGPSPYRLCSVGDHAECGPGDAGCRRTDTLLAWEAENPGTYVSASTFWGAGDQYFVENGVMYYYKPYLQTILTQLVQDFQSDTTNTNYTTIMAELITLVPEANATLLTTQYPTTLTAVRAIIDSAPSGMPTFIKETDNFYCFEDVGTAQVTADNITRETLSLIQSTFTSGYTLPYWSPCDALCLNNNKVYWTDLLRWANVSSPELRAGIVLVGDNFSFYPYASLDTKGQQIINLAGNYLATEFNKPFTIVNL